MKLRPSESKPPVAALPMTAEPESAVAVVNGTHTTSPITGNSFDVPLDQLVRNPENIRQTYDHEYLEQLGCSLQTQGQLVDLLVTRSDDHPGKRLIVDGSCRFLAATQKGIPTLRCREVRGDLNDGDLTEISLATLQRQDILPLDRAMAYTKLESSGLTGKDIAERLTVSPAEVSKKKSLLTIDKQFWPAINDGTLPLEKCYRWARIADAEERNRQIETYLARKNGTHRKPANTAKPTSASYETDTVSISVFLKASGSSQDLATLVDEIAADVRKFAKKESARLEELQDLWTAKQMAAHKRREAEEAAAAVNALIAERRQSANGT